ncbi:unnamed protein product, partial [Scytosiphon promiscuus]
QINDDYCDCADGADETRTPACSHTPRASRFVCTSTGALNQTIPASRVWDGELSGGRDADFFLSCAVFGVVSRSVGMCAAVVGAEGGVFAGCSFSWLCFWWEVTPTPHGLSLACCSWASAGLEARERAEEEGQRAVARWQSTLRAGEVDAEVRKQELQAVEKLEVLLKARAAPNAGGRLAAWDRCDKTATSGSERARGAAAALGACEDNTAEMEAAAKVRAARAAAGARRDAGEEKEGRQQQQPRRGKSDRGKSRHPATAEDVLELQWSVDAGAGGDVGQRRSEATMLSLKTYKVAEELRKTALLGPVLNDGERGVYLGLTVLLRMAGLPLLSPLRGLLAACGRFLRQSCGLARVGRGGSMRSVCDNNTDRNMLPLPLHHSDRREEQYPTLRSVVIRWDEFLEGDGRFLLVMWDAPVALWSFFFPARDDEHERPE